MYQHQGLVSNSPALADVWYLGTAVALHLLHARPVGHGWAALTGPTLRRLMKPPAFDYLAARSLEQALAAKAQYGDEARFLAGGQSLVPAMNFRLVRPAVLIDLNPVAGLDRLERQPTGGLRVGALVRHAKVEGDHGVVLTQPLLAEAIREVAHPQVRNRGTLCGNLCHADPASELPAVMLALEARMRACSVRGERWISAADFFCGTYSTALRVDEMLVDIELAPRPPRSGSAFIELARRPGDYAMMGVAVSLHLDAGGSVAGARIVACGAGDRPVHVAAAPAPLRLVHIDVTYGAMPEQCSEAVTAAADALARGIDPPGTVHASGDYQRHLARVLGERAIRLALARAAAGSTTGATSGAAAALATAAKAAAAGTKACSAADKL